MIAAIRAFRSESGIIGIAEDAKCTSWDALREAAQSVQHIESLSGWGAWQHLYRVSWHDGHTQLYAVA
jgi:hypothetical protein